MKTKKGNVLFFAGSLLFAFLYLTACQKDVANGDVTNARQLSVYLTDAPCDFDSVFIDIRNVEVKIDTTSHMDDDHHGDNDHDDDDDNGHHDEYGTWDTLQFTPGVYNVAALRNGIDTLLGTANIPAGALRKIRFTLGTNNSIVKNGVTYPLRLQASNDRYVYVQLQREHEEHFNSSQSGLWIDFDICKSIRLNNGQYFLKPYLKPFNHSSFGEIEGKVFPAAAQATVSAVNAVDSGFAVAETNGKYKIRGLRPGTYRVVVDGNNGYADTTLLNIQVQSRNDTELPAITLRR